MSKKILNTLILLSYNGDLPGRSTFLATASPREPMIRIALVLTTLLQLNGDGGEASRPSSEPLSGFPADPAAPIDMYDGSARQLDVPAPFMDDPQIEIDGRLDDPAWSRAAILTGFTQYDPVEGSAASERTEVRMLVGRDALYFALRADDSSNGVRATLTERDGFGRSDDYIRIVLDTFNDQRRAYVFMVNPLGVQADGLWVEGSGRGYGDPIDWAPDFLWQSVGRVDPEGYQAEVRIPIKSLRFPESGVQNWGLQIQRSIRRTGYSQSWAPITSEQANRLAQSGTLSGLRDLDPGMFLEVNPTVVASRTGSYARGIGSFTHDSPQGEMGLNVTYGLTSNLTLDGTVNPDFSQVEADAGQIAVNERFALFLPEQRPFFLEGAEIFSMPERLVYTRSIGNPIAAAKLSGKVGSFNVAYLGAVDEVDGGATKPVVNLLRFKRDIGASSAVGMVYTDRTDPEADFNRVIGADGRFVLGGRYTLEVMAAASADGTASSSPAAALPGLGSAAAATDTGAGAPGAEPTRWGSFFSASLERSGRSFSAEASFKDIAHDFRAGSGFIRQTGITRMDAEAGYSVRGKRGDLVESWGPSFEIEGVWDRDAFWAGRGPQESQLGVGFRAFLRGNVGAFMDFRRDAFRFDRSFYGSFRQGVSETGLEALSQRANLFSGLYSVSLRTWIRRWERVRVSAGGGWGETPIFAGAVPVDLGNSRRGDIGVTLYPTGSLEAELGARHVSISRKRDGSTYSSATIPRVQARYQISRSLFVRGIGEYSSQERGDLRDPVTGRPVFECEDGTCVQRTGSDVHDFRVEALLAYERSPGSVFFLGYTRQFEDSSAFDFRGVQPVADGFFVKLSYRFRM
ncbi:MAG: carbohydrate binding family 9 domain-containing protein [Gemmatimonadota bacterium]|nr:carbohydrate binding family 9 domain-containing protein [Gemmatimonadota bacterium]